MKKSKLHEYPDFLNEYWFNLVVAKGKSERTVEGYLIDIRTFLRYLIYMDSEEEIDFEKISIRNFDVNRLENVSLQKIYEYIYFLQGERKNNAKTISRKISSLKSLYKYLTKSVMILKNDPTTNLELPKLKKTMPKYLTLEQSQDLLESAEDDGNYSARDYCIITLFLNCGMRLSELVGLNLSDINFTENKMKLLGKGNKERYIYFNNACRESLLEYINSRENSVQDPDAVFLSRKNRRISRRRVEQIIDNHLRKIGLSGQGYSVHKLRHTAATLMYQYGNVDTLTLKEILGHESIATTEIYTHLSSNILQNAAESSPLANIHPKKKKEENE
ncbi:MAG: tyrosine-type recombinase/integrase [Oscillospiraceae bacterium]|nr:tyrosine-type recombinase/integrase [Oscillospiraceae bacterium]